MSEDGLVGFYSELVERVGDSRLQLYLYHIPQMTGVPLGLGVIERLVKAYPETIVGIKDSSGDWENTKAILRNFPQLTTFPSSESRLLEGFSLGAAGCISATANLNVRMIRALIDAGPGPRGEALHGPVAAIRQAVERRPLIPALKGVFGEIAAIPNGRSSARRWWRCRGRRSPSCWPSSPPPASISAAPGFAPLRVPALAPA